jgi:integrase
MAEIFKPTYSATDPKTGRKVKRKSPRWWIRYYTPDGQRHKVKGYTDRKATETLAAELVKQGERLAGGLATPFDEHAKTPLLQHADDYRGYLTAKGSTPRHVDYTLTAVRAALAECNFVKIGDVQPSIVLSFLAGLRSKGKSIRTANYYLTAFKGFTRWLWKDRRAAVDALAGMSRLPNEASDVRHGRRDLSADELDWLLRAARDSEQSFRDLDGIDRLHLYLTAAASGLRVAELGSLTPESFDLGAEPPIVRVHATHAKNRKQAEQPLPLDVADALRDFLDGKPAGIPVWPGTWKDRAAAMLRVDLTAARAKWLESFHDARQRDDMDHVDAHSLRHTFISRIVASGASAKVAQHLARHSTVTLTLGRYAHASLHDVSAAVDSLAGMVPSAGPGQGALAATGTDGKQIPLGPFLGPQSEKTGYKAGQSGTQAAAIDTGLSASQTTENMRKTSDLPREKGSAPSRTRTGNPLIKSQLLYQLS